MFAQVINIYIEYIYIYILIVKWQLTWLILFYGFDQVKTGKNTKYYFIVFLL